MYVRPTWVDTIFFSFRVNKTSSLICLMASKVLFIIRPFKSKKVSSIMWSSGSDLELLMNNNPIEMFLSLFPNSLAIPELGLLKLTIIISKNPNNETRHNPEQKPIIRFIINFVSLFFGLLKSLY